MPGLGLDSLLNIEITCRYKYLPFVIQKILLTFSQGPPTPLTCFSAAQPSSRHSKGLSAPDGLVVFNSRSSQPTRMAVGAIWIHSQTKLAMGNFCIIFSPSVMDSRTIMVACLFCVNIKTNAGAIPFLLLFTKLNNMRSPNIGNNKQSRL